MNFNKMTKEEMINIIKNYCVYCKDNIPNTPFKKGEWYLFDSIVGEDIIDNSGQWWNLYDEPIWPNYSNNFSFNRRNNYESNDF